MYISTHYIQNNVSKYVHMIMRKCALETKSLILTEPVIMSMIC
jgi:uncharacterized membrane protein